MSAKNQIQPTESTAICAPRLSVVGHDDFVQFTNSSAKIEDKPGCASANAVSMIAWVINNMLIDLSRMYVLLLIIDANIGLSEFDCGQTPPIALVSHGRHDF